MVENEVLRSWDLDGKNLVGIGSDGASVMVGKNNSVATLLKKDWPHVILMRCICHSLDLIKNSFINRAKGINESIPFDWIDQPQHAFEIRLKRAIPLCL